MWWKTVLKWVRDRVDVDLALAAGAGGAAGGMELVKSLLGG